jgi:hypothetical protein
MNNLPLVFNPIQYKCSLYNANKQVDIWGRGTGKSNNLAVKIKMLLHKLPKSKVLLVGSSYAMILENTVIPLLSSLHRLGYEEDVHYFINKFPAQELDWPKAYEAPKKPDWAIFFNTGMVIKLGSLDRPKTMRGQNVDFIMNDEGLLTSKTIWDNVIMPTNRANRLTFKDEVLHRGFHIASSMPWDKSGKWLLEFGNYYLDEFGIPIFQIWNRIVKMQLQLFEIDNHKDFAHQWNLIEDQKKLITPRVSKKGMLFTLANGFDNIANLGFSYLKNQKDTLLSLAFLIEVMNYIYDTIDGCFYNLEEHHVDYDTYDYDYIDNGSVFVSKTKMHSRWQKDINPNEPIYMSVDWGSKVNCFVFSQEDKDIKGNITERIINTYHFKPPKMIDDVVNHIDSYFGMHNKKIFRFVPDKFGNNTLSSGRDTYNDEFIKKVTKLGWKVEKIHYPYQEAPYLLKYYLINNCFAEKSTKFPKIRLNGNTCKDLLMSMRNTQVKEDSEGNFIKDKSDERKTDLVFPQEHAQHYGDAFDKLIWGKYHKLSNKSVTYGIPSIH